MYKFLGKSLTVAALVLMAGACGPKLSKEKEDLLNKGDKPLNELQGEDKKKVEQALMSYLAKDFDFESFEKSYSLMASHSRRLGGDKAQCEKALKEYNDGIKKPKAEELSKHLKNNEVKIKAHFADVAMKQFVGCADQLPKISKYVAEKICPLPVATAAAEPKVGDNKPKTGDDKPKADADKPKTDDAMTAFMDGLKKNFSEKQEEANKCHTLMSDFTSFWNKLAREGAVAVGEGHESNPEKEGKPQAAAVPEKK